MIFESGLFQLYVIHFENRLRAKKVSIKNTISRIRIVLKSFLSIYQKSSVVKNQNVLIVFQQLYGDSILIQSSLDAYTKIFPTSEGYKIFFLVRPSVLTFMQETMPLPKSILYRAIDFKKFLSDYKYYKEVINEYKDLAGTVIVPGTSLSAEIFSCAVNSRRKIGLVRSIDLKHPLIRAFFAHKAYNEIVRPSKEEMMLTRHRKLVNYLGNLNYQSSLPLLLKKERIIKGAYAVICPGASKAEKCWSIKKYAKIADYLISTFNFNVHLCGGKGEEKYAEQLKNEVKHPERIINNIGKTSFSEWSSIIQYASLVIGNDSASLHIAIAGRVPSICITGVYDKYQFFPYQVDVLEDGDLLPITIMKEQSCEWCRTFGYDAGYGNRECANRIKKDKDALCISEIEISDVIEQINKMSHIFCSKKGIA